MQCLIKLQYKPNLSTCVAVATAAKKCFLYIQLNPGGMDIFLQFIAILNLCSKLIKKNNNK